VSARKSIRVGFARTSVMTVSGLAFNAWAAAERQGFHKNWKGTREEIIFRLCLVHTVVSEAVQEVKRFWTEDPAPATRAKVAEELADVLIRIGDLAGSLSIDLEAAIIDKMEKNEKRPYAYGTPNEGKEGGGI